jgi:6-phosphogluconolactonase/glucosamine-6-phosphate isomerase/deaminase
MLEFTKHGSSGINLKVVHSLDAAPIGQHITDLIFDRLQSKPAIRPFILGLPTGATPIPFLTAFIEAAKLLPQEKKTALCDRLYVVVMDDFIDPTTKQNIDPKIQYSAVGFMIKNLFNPLAAAGISIDTARLLYPRAGQVGQLRDKVIKLGGIDMQMMATDPYQGYVAQNFPGEPFEKPEAAKFAPLGEAFLRHHPWAAAYHSITFDLSDFAKMVSANPAGTFELVITGSAKKSTLDKFLAAGKFTPDIPLTFLWEQSARTTVWTDQTLNADI